ncbi:hypothetical protein RhiirA4_530543 [Rhizophagus irregularis]|uniref:Uncharacterized protein n=1 Tax=Rhizophagus irregularis TaxID=588596 RepID=A0A2I1GV37_9GLOM|nr:hypothetical protein RhiirA4_530543 [Rhizophagus irregularis]
MMFGFNPREPFLFRTIRGIFIVVFAAAFIFYTTSIFYKQRKNFNQSDLIISTYETSNIPDLTQFSPATSNNITTDIGITCMIRNETCNSNICSCEDYFTQNYTQGCLTFSPILINQTDKITKKRKSTYSINGSIVFNITNTPPAGNYFAIKFNHAYIDDLNPPEQKLDSKLYPFNQGSWILLEFDIKIRKRYENLFSKAYGFSPKLINATANVKSTELQQAINSPTILVLKPNDNIVYVEEETFQYSIGLLISSLGGFYGAIYGVYVLLFGPGRISPWGLTQNYMCCWDIRREYERKLAKRYVSRAKIPLVDSFPSFPNNENADENDKVLYKDVDKNDTKKRIEILEITTKGRIERLEAMLEEFYLDASYFKTLKGVIKANESYKHDYIK